MSDQAAERLQVPTCWKGLNNMLKKFCCWIGWHSYFVGFEDSHHSEHDPARFLVFARCTWCKYEGQIDSQGNLF